MSGEESWKLLSGARTRVTFALSLALSSVLSYFVVVQSMRNENPFDLVVGKPQTYKGLLPGTLTLEYTRPVARICDAPEACERLVAPREHLAIKAFDIPQAVDEGFKSGEEWRVMHVRFTVRPETFETQYSAVSAVLHLPRMRFQEADVFLDGRVEARFFSGERLYVPLSSWRLGKETLQGEIVLHVLKEDAVQFVNWSEPPFLTDMVGKQDYIDFMRARETHPVRQINSLVRVAIAIFALLLFLIIESSHEALGLALFMGFDALMMLVGFYDLRQSWLPTTVNLTFIEYFCGASACAFRLFFYLHLSRTLQVSAPRWLAWSLLFSVPYATLLYLTLPDGWTWQRYVVGGCDGLVAAVGLYACARRAYRLRTAGVPWRIGALLLAAAAATAQLVELTWNYPMGVGELLGAPTLAGKVLFIVATNSAYLPAVATFINISTLENRVLRLSQERVKAQAIERELELGRSVQQAFMTLPALPPSLQLETYHEGAVYVSGDTFYTDWNEGKQRFVCLLNDVTGHGVQAALKAFGVTVIARQIWGDGKDGDRLTRFDQAIKRLISGDSFNALVGVELDEASGEASLYRVNYTLPLLVEPAAGGGWDARPLNLPSQTVVRHRLQPGALLVLLSDGFVAGSRDTRDLLKVLKAALASQTTPPRAAEIKTLVLAWAEQREDAVVDDRTLLVLQWQPAEAALRLAS